MQCLPVLGILPRFGPFRLVCRQPQLSAEFERLVATLRLLEPAAAFPFMLNATIFFVISDCYRDVSKCKTLIVTAQVHFCTSPQA
jgi:hypothetical protein